MVVTVDRDEGEPSPALAASVIVVVVAMPAFRLPEPVSVQSARVRVAHGRRCCCTLAVLGSAYSSERQGLGDDAILLLQPYRQAVVLPYGITNACLQPAPSSTAVCFSFGAVP
ncbi:Os10g0433925 [Oryza sativa Japonica Group]|uniref:Os10g0433925 protein n=1 Tax=Oryza sativa subsp. japonica TaxID=39947 RepID=A0A0P0XUH0_ORYSJ|nr:Os10g0433925 [Oryza sativa Japonica Group]